MQSSVLRQVVAWLLVLVVVAAGARTVVALPEHCGSWDAETLDRSAEEAVDWFARNQLGDGTWRYRWDVEAGRDLGGYTWVRHAGVLLSLEQARAAGIAAAGPVAERGRAGALGHVRTFGDVSALDDQGRLTAGGTALLVVALLERRATTGDTEDDAVLRRMGRFLAGQVAGDGSVDERADPVTGSPERGTPSAFTTGEVAYALAALERAFPGEGFGTPVRPVLRYAALDRPVREGFVPDASDHWSAYALAEVVRWGDPAEAALTPLELAWARKQLGVLGVQVRFEAQRTNGGIDRWVRGRTALGAGVGTLGEALGRWAGVAAAEASLGGRRGWIRERLACTAGVLAARQLDAGDAAASGAPEVARGAWTQFGITQMDDQQHALSAVLAARSLLHGARPAAGDGDGDDRLVDGGVLPRRSPVPSSAWVVGLAVLAGWSPSRVAGGAAGRGRRVVAAGSGLAVVVLGLTAAVGGPVLRALDVSVPTGVVAAGLVLGVAGLLTFVRPGRGPESGANGWRGALVPVLVPLTLRPELVPLMLVAGAGGRGWAAGAGLVAGGVASWALSPSPSPPSPPSPPPPPSPPSPPSPPPSPSPQVSEANPGSSDSPENRWSQGRGVVVGWGVRVAAVVAVACGIVLIVDGVYSI